MTLFLSGLLNAAPACDPAVDPKFRGKIKDIGFWIWLLLDVNLTISN
jgi:hypothetical protein